MEKKQYNFEDGLKKGIQQIIQTWPVLNFILENGLAQQNMQRIKTSGENYKSKKNNKYHKSDKEIQDEMIQELFDYTFNYQITKPDVEDWLLDYMDQHFFTVIEDNSEKLIAEYIIKLIDDLEDGKNDVLEEILKKCEELKTVKVQANLDDSDKEEGDEEDEYTDCDEEYEEEEQEETEEQKKQKEQQKQLEDDGWAMAGQTQPTVQKKDEKIQEQDEEFKKGEQNENSQKMEEEGVQEEQEEEEKKNDNEIQQNSQIQQEQSNQNKGKIQYNKYQQQDDMMKQLEQQMQDWNTSKKGKKKKKNNNNY